MFTNAIEDAIAIDNAALRGEGLHFDIPQGGGSDRVRQGGGIETVIPDVVEHSFAREHVRDNGHVNEVRMHGVLDLWNELAVEDQGHPGEEKVDLGHEFAVVVAISRGSGCGGTR